MSTFDHFGDMYDVAFKPRLLQTIVRDDLPEENEPFPNPSVVSKVVSLVKTHRLLSESFADSTDPKRGKAWKSAVTTWVERVLALLGSNMPDKCWAGVSLLGVTCEECSSERFQESYSVWFQKLLPFLQSSEDSFIVRVAACISISDLLARLNGFPKFKKEGSSCAVKVIQPVLKLLSDCNSEAIWEAAIHLLCTIITSFPFSIHRHYDSVESALASKLLFGGCSLDVSKKLVHCLALLPKSRADEESWSVMLQKFLIVINDKLNFAFQGVEEETKRKEVTRLLVPSGKHPPPPLGGHTLTEEASSRATKRSERPLMSNVPTLMSGCCLMLTNSYPVKVNVPVRLLLALVERILMVNGSMPPMSQLFMTAKQQEDICSELPQVHSCTLELLTAIIKAMGSQLLPHAGSIARIITKYFRMCALPELRIKNYSVARTLLLSMGVGMALYLAQDVVNNAFSDLDTSENKSGDTLNNGLNSNALTAPWVLQSHKKRKHSSTTGQEHDNGVGSGVEVTKNCPVTPMSLRIAALEALEALITVAGSLRSEPWRSKVDNLLIVIAKDSFKEGSANEEISVFQRMEPPATTSDLQLATLRALLASFLSFTRFRPPHLSQGLDLFRRGKEQTGTKLAEFCIHALFILEVLIHPRGLPLPSHGETQCNSRDENFGRSDRTPFGFPQAGYDTIDTDDDLCARWLENGNDAIAPLPKNAKLPQETSEARIEGNPNVLSMLMSSGNKTQERNKIDVSEAAANADVEMRPADYELVSKSDQPIESAVQSQEPESYTTSSVAAEASMDAATNIIASEMIVSDGAMTHNEGNRSRMESGQGSSANKFFESVSNSTSFLQRTSDSTTIHVSALKLDHVDSLTDDDDPFPDIVDGDPDSDSD